MPDPTGYEMVVDLPLGPVQPRRFLDAVSGIPGAVDSEGVLRWLNGLRWRPWACRDLTVGADSLCDPEDLTATPTDECVDFAHQLPFRIEDAATNTVLEEKDDGQAESRLSARYARQLSAAFAHELLAGTASGGVSLSSEATEPSVTFGTAAQPIWNALAVLEAEIAERLDGGVGYIHLPPGLLALSITYYGVHLEGGQWMTPVGNVVISDAGYVNAPEPDGEAASADGEDWVYVSGPVFVERTSGQIYEGAEDIERDTAEWRIHGYGIIVFDPCPVTAILVSYDIEP